MIGRERSTEGRRERKSDKGKIAVSSGDLGAACGYVSRRRRRRVPRVRRISAEENSGKDAWSKTRKSLDDDDEELEDRKGGDNRVTPLSSTETKGLVAKLRQKELLISRMRRKYVRLQKRNRNVKEECRRLNGLLEARDGAYRRACSRYDKVVELLGEVEKTKAELSARNRRLKMERARWNEDAALLKAVVYRLNSELEKYQDKLGERELEAREQRRRSGNEGSEGSDESDSTFVAGQIARTWGRVDLHVFAPLLNAYEVSLAEKKSLIARYEREITRTGGECKKVIAENERMHAEVEELRSQCGRYAEESRAFNQSVLSLKKQSDAFAREVEDRKAELEEIQWSYERKVKSMVDEIESLRRQWLTSVAESEEYRERYDALSEEVERMKNRRERTVPMEVHSAAIEQCKRLFEELKQRYEGEKSRLSTRIRFIQENQCEKDDRLTSLMAERNHFEALTKILRRNVKRSQTRVDYVRRIAYSGRASRESMKNQLSKAVAFCRELFVEYERVVAERERLAAVLRETERENADFDRIGKSIARRVDDLKNDLIIVQNGATRQMDTMEKRIKIQECRVHSVRRKYRGKVRRLRKLIKQKEDIIRSLRREKCGSRDNVGTVERLPDDDKLKKI